VTAPIYIPSLGRWESRYTVKALDRMGVTDYLVIVDEHEWSKYASVIDKRHLLVLDPAFVRDYDARDDKGMSIPKGSGPKRNMAWEHSTARGASWHWVVDDNITEFYRLHAGQKHRVRTPAFFEAMETFCDRYVNIAMAGPHYEMFIYRRMRWKPFAANRRIFSCNLIRNDVPFRWRCRYNEDLDLSLRMLKAGWCTVLFNAFLQGKMATQRMKGGNTDALYRSGTEAKSRMIVAEHPDVATLKWNWGRAHHYIDMRPFRGNRLRLREGVVIPAGSDEFGMKLRSRRPKE